MFLGSPDHLAIRLRHWGLSVPQVVLLSYAGAAVLGGIGLLVMSVPQDLALVLSVMTLLGLGAAAVALTRVNVSTRSSSSATPQPGVHGGRSGAI